MKKHTKSKHNASDSFGASLFLLMMLASLFSSCSSVIQIPVPAETIAQTAPVIEDPATMEPTSVPPTEEPTQTPTHALTPEPTVTPTQGIDFTIPEAPQGVDPEKWKDAYISGMQSSGYLRLKIEAGLAKPSWDQNLDTLIWDLGKEKFAYNSKFDFTGDVVFDVFGNNWIVRKKLTHSRGYVESIFWYDNLHDKDSEQLILGAQCVEMIGDSHCALVGQVVGQEKIDMSQYLIDDFDSLSNYDAGIFYNRKNLVFDVLAVRIPNGYNKYVELKVPIGPENYSSRKDIVDLLSGPKTSDISGKQILEKTQDGSMIFLISIAYHSFPAGMTVDKFKEYIFSNPEFGDKLSVFEAFGTGEHLGLIMDKYLNIPLYSQHYCENPAGRLKIFDTEKMVEDKITQVVGLLLLR